PKVFVAAPGRTTSPLGWSRRFPRRGGTGDFPEGVEPAISQKGWSRRFPRRGGTGDFPEGAVAATSQKGWNRQFSTAHRPPNEAGKAIRAAECQGQTQKRKSRLLRCVHKGPLRTTSIAPYRSFPPATPSRSTRAAVFLRTFFGGISDRAKRSGHAGSARYGDRGRSPRAIGIMQPLAPGLRLPGSSPSDGQSVAPGDVTGWALTAADWFATVRRPAVDLVCLSAPRPG